jgi:hypothetical protein
LADEAALELDPEVILKRMMLQRGKNFPFGPAPLSALDRIADASPDRSRLPFARKSGKGSGDLKHGHGGPPQVALKNVRLLSNRQSGHRDVMGITEMPIAR